MCESLFISVFMGRTGYKSTAEESRRISVSHLKEWGYFSGRYGGSIIWKHPWGNEHSSISVFADLRNRTIRLCYSQTSLWTEEKREIDYCIPLTTTRCHFGGRRYWFICPLSVNGQYCGRRVATLYKAPGSWYWGCGRCQNITYESRNVNRRGYGSILLRALDLETKAEKLEEKIKRWYWRGRPTRKHRRVLKYIQIAQEYSPLIDKIKSNK